MKTIFKYTVGVEDHVTIELPEGAKILTASAVQLPPNVADIFHIWAEVETTAAPVPRRLRIFGTGHPMHDVDDLRYIGTAFCAAGALVWHVYEVE